MNFSRFKSNRARRIVLTIALVGVFHFFIALFEWFFTFGVIAQQDIDSVIWPTLLHAIPAIVLFFLFIATAVLAWRRIRASILLLLFTIAISATAFLYDISTNNYQMQTMTKEEGCRLIYFNWWWYDERWFY